MQLDLQLLWLFSQGSFARGGGHWGCRKALTRSLRIGETFGKSSASVVCLIADRGTASSPQLCRLADALPGRELRQRESHYCEDVGSIPCGSKEVSEDIGVAEPAQFLAAAKIRSESFRYGDGFLGVQREITVAQ